MTKRRGCCLIAISSSYTVCYSSPIFRIPWINIASSSYRDMERLCEDKIGEKQKNESEIKGWCHGSVVVSSSSLREHKMHRLNVCQAFPQLNYVKVGRCWAVLTVYVSLSDLSYYYNKILRIRVCIQTIHLLHDDLVVNHYILATLVSIWRGWRPGMWEIDQHSYFFLYAIRKAWICLLGKCAVTYFAYSRLQEWWHCHNFFSSKSKFAQICKMA